METKAHHVLIGAFVLLALIGAALFGLWIAKSSLANEFNEYDVLFTDPVTGLTKGASVNFNGIQVGEVRRLRLDGTDISRVWARIRVDEETPVKADTTARLTYTGLTGVVIIELVAGKADAPPMLVPAGAEVAIILAKPSAIQKLLAEGGDVLIRVTEALKRVTTVLSEENTDRLEKTLMHIDAIAAQIDADKALLGSALRSAERTFADAGETAQEFRRLATNGNSLLDKEIAPAAQDLKLTLAELREVSKKVDRLLARNSAHIDQFARDGLPGITATLEDLRTLVGSLNRVADRLNAAPADYLLQRDRPREYRAK